MEDGAEEGGVYLGAYFIGSFQAGYVSVVEFQAAVQIGIEGRGGEERFGTLVDVVGVEGCRLAKVATPLALVATRLFPVSSSTGYRLPPVSSKIR